MPLRQDFGSFRQPVDATSPLMNALTNVQAMFAKQESDDENKRRYDQELLVREAALAEDKRRYEEGMKFKNSAEARAIASDGRAIDLYNRSIKERDSTDLFLRELSKPKQEIGGWLNPSNTLEQKAIDDIGVFSRHNDKGELVTSDVKGTPLNLQSEYVDSQGKPITKEEADTRLATQLSLGSLAGNSPSQVESEADVLRRANETVRNSGGLPTLGMHQELLQAEAAEKTVAQKRIEEIEKTNAKLLADKTKLELDSSKTEYKESNKSSKGSGSGYKLEDWTLAQEADAEKVSPLGLGADASKIRDVYAHAQEKGIPLVVVQNAVSRATKAGASGTSFDNTVISKYIQEEENAFKGKKGGYADATGYKAKVAATVNAYDAAYNKGAEKLRLLNMDPDAVKAAQADALFAGVMGKYASANKPAETKAATNTASSTNTAKVVKEPTVVPVDKQTKAAVAKVAPVDMAQHSLPVGFGTADRVIPKPKVVPGYEVLGDIIGSGAVKLGNHIKETVSQGKEPTAVKAGLGLLANSAAESLNIATSPYNVIKMGTDEFLFGEQKGSVFTDFSKDTTAKAVTLLENAGVTNPTTQQIAIIGSSLVGPGGALKSGVKSAKEAATAVRKVLTDPDSTKLLKGSRTLKAEKAADVKAADLGAATESAKNDLYLIEEGFSSLKGGNRKRYQELVKEATAAGYTNVKAYVKKQIELLGE